MAAGLAPRPVAAASNTAAHQVRIDDVGAERHPSGLVFKGGLRWENKARGNSGNLNRRTADCTRLALLGAVGRKPQELEDP